MTKIVSPPAADGSVVEECAGVLEAGGDCGGGASGAEVDGVSWSIGAVGATVCKLTVVVESPAFCFTVVEDGAGVVVAGGDCGGGAAGAEVDGRAWCVGVGATVSKLTKIVITPALHGAVVEDGAGVLEACGDCGGGAVGAEVDGCAWFVGVGVGFVAELTVFVVSPAGDLTVVEECAGVSATGGDGGCGTVGAKVDGVAWCVGVGGVAVTELTEKVISPAGDGAVVEECTGVLVADRNNRRDAASSEGNSGTWRIGIGGITDTKLTIVVISPTLSAAVGQQSTSVISPTADLNRVVRVCSSDCRT